MITNERQYRITKAQAESFRIALARVDEEYRDQEPILRQAMREQIESQLSDLVADLEAYEQIRTSGGSTLQLSSVEELPQALVWARISSGLTQRELAALIGVSEQQVQRDEATMYANASFERLVAIGRALSMETALQVTLPAAAYRESDPVESRDNAQQSAHSTGHAKDTAQDASRTSQVGHVRRRAQ
jgi:transcriptional regulator with XRE-family HTH domain